MYEPTYFRTWSQRLLNWREFLQHLGMKVENVASICRVLASTVHWNPRWEGLSSDETCALAFASCCHRIVMWLRDCDGPQEVGSLMLSMTNEVETMVSEITALLGMESEFGAT